MQLPRERNLLVRISLKKGSQQGTEVEKHLLGRSGIFLNQRPDGMKGVEQEMRMQLHLEDLQLRLRQVLFKLHLAQLAFGVLPVVGKSLGKGGEPPIGSNKHGYVLAQIEPYVIAHRLFFGIEEVRENGVYADGN